VCQDEQREAKLWDRAARQEIDESVAAGSKVTRPTRTLLPATRNLTETC
jgi:hypothetical protein